MTGRACSDRSGCSQGPWYRHRHEQDCAPHRLTLCPVHVLWPTRTLCTLVHQTTLPEGTPSQAPLSRNPPAAAPTHSETRVLPGQPLLPTHTAEQGAVHRAALPEGHNPSLAAQREQSAGAGSNQHQELWTMCRNRVRLASQGIAQVQLLLSAAGIPGPPSPFHPNESSKDHYPATDTNIELVFS